VTAHSAAQFALIAIGITFGLSLLAFWLWMLVDALTREPSADDRLVWTLVICLTQLLGAALYYLLRYRRRGLAELVVPNPKPLG
jgi:hypothetical protein